MENISSGVLEEVFNSMNDDEFADYILTTVCNDNANAGETTVIDILGISILTIRNIKNATSISPTRLFNVVQIIMNNLKDVSLDGGIVEITKA